MGRLEEFYDYVADKVARHELTTQEAEDLLDDYAKRLGSGNQESG